MQLQDSAHPQKTQYRGADWQAIQRKWSRPDRPAGASDAAAGGTPPPSGRLGSSTHFDTYTQAARQFDGPAYLAILKGYGQNGAKLVLRTVHDKPNPTPPEPSDTPRKSKVGTPRAEADPINVQKSAWRARSKIEDWVRMTATPGTDLRLVTLTRRHGFTTLAAVWDALAAFRRKVEHHYPGVRMCAVPEFHWGQGENHGTYHVHVAMIFQPGQRPLYAIFHRLWYRSLGGTGKESGPATPGNCDFAPVAPRGSTTRYTPCQAARYLAKYITKDLLHGNIGQKRFTTTHGAPDPVKRYWWEPIAFNQRITRARAVSLLRQWFPAETHAILSRTFNTGGDTYHVFSAEPVLNSC